MGFKWLEKDLNKALVTAGNKDRYQFIIVGILCCIFFLNIFLIVGTSIYFMDPVFECQDSSKTVDQSYACDKLDKCKITNDFTIVAKMKLYCEDQYKRSIIQSSLSIGSLFGLILMNIVSDIKGRKFALMADLIIAIVSAAFTYLGAVIQSTWLLTLASVLSGFSGYSLIIISYIILGDVCQESMRQKSSVYINMCLSLGLTMFFVLYNWCNQWYTIIILFMLIPLSAICVICYIFVQQSPNYELFQVRDSAACIRSLINIAKINSKTYVEAQKIKYFVNKIKAKLEKEPPKNIQLNALSALSKWKYLKVIICMSIVESGGNLCFYAIQYAVNDIGYSFGVNNLLIGLVEIATTLVVGKYVVDLPRKKTLIITYAIVPVLTSFFIFDSVSQSAFLCTFLILITRVMTTTGYLMIVMIQTQSFPLEIQSIGAGSIEGFSQLGSFVAPILIAFSINNGLPKISVMGFTMILCLIPIIFVNQTSSKQYKFLIRKVEPTSEDLRQVKSSAPYY